MSGYVTKKKDMYYKDLDSLYSVQTTISEAAKVLGQAEPIVKSYMSKTTEGALGVGVGAAVGAAGVAAGVAGLYGVGVGAIGAGAGMAALGGGAVAGAAGGGGLLTTIGAILAGGGAAAAGVVALPLVGGALGLCWATMARAKKLRKEKEHKYKDTDNYYNGIINALKKIDEIISSLEKQLWSKEKENEALKEQLQVKAEEIEKLKKERDNLRAQGKCLLDTRTKLAHDLGLPIGQEEAPCLC